MNKPQPCDCCPSDDHGPEAYCAHVAQAASQNTAFRSAYWTGCHLQMTLMSIPQKCDIGVEMHKSTDQYIRVEEGKATAKYGCCCDKLDKQCSLDEGEAIFIPAGTWHNIINTGSCPLKLSSVYAPPQHPRCTLQPTKQDT